MDRANDFEKFLTERMSVEATDIQSPHSFLAFEARERVLARKKITSEQPGFLEKCIHFFRLDFKFYHVGLSLLLISAGVFYVNEPNYTNNDSSAFNHYDEALSIKNTTISVNSSTMLTSIPTLVIRN